MTDLDSFVGMLVMGGADFKVQPPPNKWRNNVIYCVYIDELTLDGVIYQTVFIFDSKGNFIA